jgi:cholinesterase
MDELRTKSSPDFMLSNAVMAYYSQYGYFRFGPTVDETYVPDPPGKLLGANRYHCDINVELGHTQLDGPLFIPPWIRSNAALANYIRSLYPMISDEDLRRVTVDYPIIQTGPRVEILGVMDLLDDITISCNNYYLTEAGIAAENVALYRYIFNAPPAMHGSEVFYTVSLLYSFKTPIPYVLRARWIKAG